MLTLTLNSKPNASLHFKPETQPDTNLKLKANLKTNFKPNHNSNPNDNLDQIINLSWYLAMLWYQKLILT